jgi:molybdenum cofactor cytidylyltransferase
MGSPQEVDKPPLAGVLLAAGSSTRLGQPKQLIAFNGVPLVVHAAKQALDQCDAGLIIVTGACHEAVVEVLNDLPVRAIYNPNWREGMASSIRTGVTGIAQDAGAILLMVCDQAMIDRTDIAGLVSAWKLEAHQIAAAGYAGSHGVPAIFPDRFRAGLLKLHGDRGAKSIIDAAANVSVVDMPNAEFDLDTVDQLENLKI